MEFDHQYLESSDHDNVLFHSKGENSNDASTDAALDTQNGMQEADSIGTVQIGNESHQSYSQYTLRKWTSLSEHFSERYLELFNKITSPDSDEDCDFLESQTGAVKWTPAEKHQLFTAVARCGRHNVARLVDAVETKSSIEITAYLDSVRTAYVDRQIFASHPMNIAIAEIPAAIEIGPECQDALDKAADALNAYQERYDMAVSENDYGRLWLIDRGFAAQLTDKNDKAEIDLGYDKKYTHDARRDSEGAPPGDRVAYLESFNLLTMLDLSEMFFMNHLPESVYPHWETIAEPGQRPAMTQDVVKTMFDLVVSRLQQIIEVAIHCAHARLCSMTNNDYTAIAKLKRSDVTTAIDILGFSHDSWDYWTGLPRRNQFRVINGSHDKGESRFRVISHDDAEAVLAPRKGIRRRRSLSMSSEGSFARSSSLSESRGQSQAEEEDEETGSSVGDEMSGKRAAKERSDMGSGSISGEEGQEDEIFTKIGWPHLSQSDATDSLDDQSNNSGDEQAMFDDADEIHAQQKDRAAQIKEESRLWQVLGKRSNQDIVEKDSTFGPPPKTHRRTREELEDWSCLYMAEWEYFGGNRPFTTPDREPEETGAETGTSEYDTRD